MTEVSRLLFAAATRVSSPWSLAAFGIAAIICVVYLLGKWKRSGKGSLIAGFAIVAIVVIALGSLYLSKVDIYRVRITVIGPQGTPTEDAKVWSSIGGEPKKVAGGWQFDIPATSRPADGKLTVWASMDSAYLNGSADAQLFADYNPSVSIQVKADQTASVRGLVVDRSNRSIAGALVTVAGYGSEAVVTQEGGNFVLPAHASREQSVLLRVEAKGYVAATQWHPAGNDPATIVLDRK
jgi:hypothetical protein